MMLPSKRGKGVSAVKAILRIFVFHPVFFVQYLTLDLAINIRSSSFIVMVRRTCSSRIRNVSFNIHNFIGL